MKRSETGETALAVGPFRFFTFAELSGLKGQESPIGFQVPPKTDVEHRHPDTFWNWLS